MDRTPALSDGANRATRYDRITIYFHWATAALVVFLFGSALLWNNVPRDFGWHRPLEFLHVSFGIVFAAVLVARVAWRWLGGRRLAPANDRVVGLASRLVHFVLYALLVLQATVGFALRWLQGEAFSFFGLFSIPQVFAPDRPLAHTLEGLHNYMGWAIIIVAAGHAIAALVHHYLLKDRVLRRMLPAAGG